MKDISVGSGSTKPVDTDPKKKKPDETPVVVDTTPTTGPGKTKEGYESAKSGIIGKPLGTTRNMMSMVGDIQPHDMDKVKRIKVTDYGDILKEMFVFLGKVDMNPNVDLKSFLRGGGSFSQAAVDDRTPELYHSDPFVKILDGLKDLGRAGGAMGRRLGFEIEWEKDEPKDEMSVGKLPRPELKSPPKPTVDKLPPYWEFNASAKYASDSAKRKKDAKGVEQDVNSPATKHRDMAASLQLSGQIKGKIKVDFHSMGVQDVDDKGELKNHTGKEANTYESVDGTPGNAKETRAKLEKARYVKAEVKKGDSGFVMTIESGCDIVKSNWDDKNMKPEGKKVVTKFAGHSATVSGSNPPVKVTMTANDVLSVARAYAEAKHHNREMLAYAIKTGQGPEFDQLRADLAKCGKDPAKLEAFFAKAETDPALANVGLAIPDKIALGRRGDDGQWHALVDDKGQPIMVSRAELDTVIANQTVTNMPSEDPSSTIQDPPRPGSELTGFTPTDADKLADANAAALNAGLEMPVTKKSGGTTKTETVDLGKPIADPAEKDEGVTTIVDHTDSPEDVQVLQDNADTVDGSLAEAALLFRNGALSQKDLSADQQKAIADAMQNYLKIKDANAAKVLRNLLYSMQKGGSVGNFINAVIKRLDASVRLNTALNQLPTSLRANINSKVGGDGATFGGTTIQGSGKTTPGMASVMHSDPKTSTGAQQIVGAVLRANQPKPNATITDWAGQIAQLQKDFKSSTQLTASSATLGKDIGHDLAQGKTPATIEADLTTKLFPTDPKPKLTVNLASDKKTFVVTMQTEKTIPKAMLDRAKDEYKAKYGSEMPAGELDKAVADYLFGKDASNMNVHVTKKGEEFVVSVSVPIAGGQVQPKKP